MRFSWLRTVLVGGIALFLFSACSDSSDVGLGVGSRADSLRGGQPTTLNVAPEVDTTRTAPLTGENVRQPPTRSTWRFLTGVVDDPIPGTGIIEAEGYIDFAGRSSLPSQLISANNADSLAAELRLTTDYLHGQSNERIAVKVYDLTAEATMDSARATASFDADETESVAVDTARITPTDSLVTIELRQSWIDEHLPILQDTSGDGADFEDTFSGFKIVAPNSEAVVGFSFSNATLRLIHEPDSATADYAALKTFTHIEQRNATGSAPTGQNLMLGGIGVGLSMNWDFDAAPLDTLENAPLNRAEIYVPLDTLALDNFSRSNFARPRPRGFRVIATRTSAADAPSCASLQLPVFSQANEACVLPLVPSAAPSAALVPDTYAFSVFQQSFQRVRNGQTPVFTRVRVFIADRENTSGNASSTIQPGLPSTLPALVPTGGEDPGPPRATLTVTPL